MIQTAAVDTVQRQPGAPIGNSQNSYKFTTGPARITVVTVRQPIQERDQQVVADIQRARLSYRDFWGQVEVWDELDALETTFNYIAYVEYEVATGDTVREALSSRMVIIGGEDAAFYHIAGRPLADMLPEILYRERRLRSRPVAMDSRIGAIRPPDSTSNAYTLDAWAAIKLRMAADARNQGVEYVGGQVRPELLRVFVRNGVRFDHPPAEELLGIPSGEIALDRTNPTVIQHILRYPGYFLSSRGLHRVVAQCIEQGVFTNQEFQLATGLRTVGDLLNPRNGRHLVPMIRCDRPTGAVLRQRLLCDVPDGTFFTLSRVQNYTERACSVLRRLANSPGQLSRRAPLEGQHSAGVQ